jgi:hypothetical protein
MQANTFWPRFSPSQQLNLVQLLVKSGTALKSGSGKPNSVFFEDGISQMAGGKG